MIGLVVALFGGGAIGAYGALNRWPAAMVIVASALWGIGVSVTCKSMGLP